MLFCVVRALRPAAFSTAIGARGDNNARYAWGGARRSAAMKYVAEPLAAAPPFVIVIGLLCGVAAGVATCLLLGFI